MRAVGVLALALLLVGCGPSKEERANRAVIEAVAAIDQYRWDDCEAAMQRVREFYRADSAPVAELVALRADTEAFQKDARGENLKGTYQRIKAREDRLRATYGTP